MLEFDLLCCKNRSVLCCRREISSLKERVRQLEAELEDHQRVKKRLQAELEDQRRVKKRMETELEDHRRVKENNDFAKVKLERGLTYRWEVVKKKCDDCDSGMVLTGSVIQNSLFCVKIPL